MAVSKRESELMAEIQKLKEENRRLKEDKAENEATYEKLIHKMSEEISGLKRERLKRTGNMTHIPKLDLNVKPEFKHLFDNAYVGPTVDGKYLPPISKQKKGETDEQN